MRAGDYLRQLRGPTGWGEGRREGSHGHGSHPGVLQQAQAPTRERVSTGKRSSVPRFRGRG